MNPERFFVLCSLLLLSLSGRGESNPAAFQLEERLPFEVTCEPGEIIGREQVIREIVKCSTNRFLIVLPATMRCESARSDSLALLSTDGGYSISFHILRHEQTGMDPRPDLKARATVLYPGAQGIEDFPTSIAGKDARVVRFRQGDPLLGERVVKVVQVPCKVGVVEFVLNSSSQTAKAASEAMDVLLLMFRTDEGGKLEILRRSEGS